MHRQVGDLVRYNSRVHGSGVGKIVRVTKWRHKVYYHVAWKWDSGDNFTSKERAGRDDLTWLSVKE